MKRYESFFKEFKDELSEEEMYRHPVTKSFFHEAVYRPDKYVSVIIEELVEFFKFFSNKKASFHSEIPQLLSKYLEPYNIKFKYIDTTDPDNSAIISMETSSKDMRIIVYCDNNMINILSDKNIQDNFIKQFKLLLGHELIHRSKFLTIQQKKFTDDLKI